MAAITIVGSIKEYVEKRANSYISLGYKIEKPLEDYKTLSLSLKGIKWVKEYKIVLCKK